MIHQAVHFMICELVFTHVYTLIKNLFKEKKRSVWSPPKGSRKTFSNPLSA